MYVKNEDLKEEIEILQERKEEVNDKIRDLYDRKDEAREKFLDMHEYVQKKEKELGTMEKRLNQLRQDYEPFRTQDDLNILVEVFPQIGESLRMTQLCRGIGLTVDTIKKLFTGEAVSYFGKLHSQEHDRDFNVQEAKLQLYKEKDNPNKLHLSVNGQNLIGWFKQKYQEVRKTTRPHVKPSVKQELSKGKGIKR